MSEDDNDKLEPTEAIPKEIPHESTYSLALRLKKRTPSDDLDGDDFGDADTDRLDFAEGPASHAAASEIPTQLIFQLRNIRSLNAECFFCKEFDCDLVFIGKSLHPGKTRAYAVHSACVFDHTQLQASG